MVEKTRMLSTFFPTKFIGTIRSGEKILTRVVQFSFQVLELVSEEATSISSSFFLPFFHPLSCLYFFTFFAKKSLKKLKKRQKDENIGICMVCVNKAKCTSKNATITEKTAEMQLNFHKGQLISAFFSDFLQF